MPKEMKPTYIYRGDRLTDPELKGQNCFAVRRPNGKCIRGRNGSMLVDFVGKKVVVIGRLLRKQGFEISQGSGSIE